MSILLHEGAKLNLVSSLINVILTSLCWVRVKIVNKWLTSGLKRCIEIRKADAVRLFGRPAVLKL
jgi:hypothetical protein